MQGLVELRAAGRWNDERRHGVSILFENWFFLLVLLLCIGMHFFGHGHGHGGREHGEPESRTSGSGARALVPGSETERQREGR